MSRQQQRSLPTLPIQTLHCIVPFLLNSSLDDVRSTSSTMRSYVDQQIPKRKQKEQKKRSQTEYNDFFQYYFDLIRKRWTDCESLPIHL